MCTFLRRTCLNEHLPNQVSTQGVPIHRTEWNFRRCCNLSVGRHREKNAWETYPIHIIQERYWSKYGIGKLMVNTAESNGVIMIHWEMNHRLDFHLCPIKQAVLSVWRSCDWERKGGGLEEREKSQVRPPPPPLPFKSYLYSAGNTLYLHWAPQQPTGQLYLMDIKGKGFLL